MDILGQKIEVGDRVAIDYKGKNLSGTISRITEKKIVFDEYFLAKRIEDITRITKLQKDSTSQ